MGFLLGFQIFNRRDEKVTSPNNAFKEEGSESIGELSYAHDPLGTKGSLSADGVQVAAS